VEFIVVALVVLVLYCLRRHLWAYIQPHLAEYAWFAFLFLLVWAYCRFQPVRDFANYLLGLFLG
jgi:hypothetical protein